MEFTLLITTIIGISGWYAIHFFNVKRDQASRKEETRLRYLLEAYRSLAIGLQWRTYNENYAISFDQALADVQLLGSHEQISKLHEFLDSIESTGNGDLDPLMETLRSELRNTLQLTPQSKNLRWHRTNVTKKVASKNG